VEAGVHLHREASPGGTTGLWASGFTLQAGAEYEAALHATNGSCWVQLCRLLTNYRAYPGPG
jgi:hypothetical protein